MDSPLKRTTLCLAMVFKKRPTKCWALSRRRLKDKQNKFPFTENHRTSWLVMLHKQFWSAHLKDRAEPKGNKEGQLNHQWQAWQYRVIWGTRDAMKMWKRLVLPTCFALSLELRGAFEVFISHGSTLFTQLPAMVASAGRLLWEVPVFHQQLGEMWAGWG